MDDYLTTRQVQDYLKVDRITVYRMLQDGRLKGQKIGQQWRFARRDVERLVAGHDMVEAGEESQLNASHDTVFPVQCVQAVQDLFSEISQVGAVVLDREGRLVTEVSHACGFCQMLLASPTGLKACQASWQAAATGSQGKGYSVCHAGLTYYGAPIMDGGKKVGTFLIGQCLLRPKEGSEKTDFIGRLAAALQLQEVALASAIETIPVIEPERLKRMSTWPVSAAHAVQSILIERGALLERLQQIADLTQIDKGVSE